MEIREVNVEEAGELAGFAGRLFRETYSPTCRGEDVEAYAAEAFTPERMREELREAAGTALVAEVEGEWAGYAQLRRGEAPAEVAGERPLEIARFYVDARWHGRGVAGELMDAVLRAAAAWGCDAAWLSVWQENGRAIRFYRRLGFGVVGSTTFRMGDDVQRDHLMARPLR